MAEDEVIRIEGLKEFHAKLRALDRELPKSLRLAGNKAADIVVRAATPKVPVGPPAGGHARSSVRAASTRTSARVRAGGARFPYYPWLDFGGSVGRKHHTKRPFIKEGRYLFPAYHENKTEVRDKLVEALTEVAEAAGLEPR